jgi:hypothetical protein
MVTEFGSSGYWSWGEEICLIPREGARAVANQSLWLLAARYVQGIHKRMVRSQMLTRNLFLNLRGYNVHRQQRQLSKFLMRYQQFASYAYWGAAGPVSKMASQHEKAFCVLRFKVSRSVIRVQREFTCTI